NTHKPTHNQQAPKSKPFPYTTLFRSRTLTKENQKKVYEEINIHKRTEELAGKLVELKKQRRGIEKNIKKQEEELVRIFDQAQIRSEEHTSELQSRFDLVCRLLLEKKK